MNSLTKALASAESGLMAELEALYKDIHRHPELSMQEVRTAKIAADAMQELGYEVTREVGVTGVAVTLFYAAVYWPLATYVMNPNLAVLVAFVLATAVGRFAHGAVSFRGHGTRDRGTAVRFTIVQALLPVFRIIVRVT